MNAKQPADKLLSAGCCQRIGLVMLLICIAVLLAGTVLLVLFALAVLFFLHTSLVHAVLHFFHLPLWQ